MFFDPLAISEIIQKSRIFSRKNKKDINKKRYLLVLNIYRAKVSLSMDFIHLILKNDYIVMFLFDRTEIIDICTYGCTRRFGILGALGVVLRPP